MKPQTQISKASDTAVTITTTIPEQVTAQTIPLAQLQNRRTALADRIAALQAQLTDIDATIAQAITLGVTIPSNGIINQ